MIDIHCHILPGIDDGATNLDVSLQMVRMASKGKTTKIIATPHYYRAYYENNFDIVEKYTHKLNREVSSRGISVEIFPGQEVFADKYTLDAYKTGAIRGLNYSKYMLIEFPMDVQPSDALDLIYELKILGVRTIIAHPERYIYIVNKPSSINKFIEEGCLFQINASSIMGVFGKEIEKTAIYLLENNVCQFVASDAHSAGKRNPDITGAMAMLKKDYEHIFKSVIQNSEDVLYNRDINLNMKFIPEKKGILSFLFKKN